MPYCKLLVLPTAARGHKINGMAVCAGRSMICTVYQYAEIKPQQNQHNILINKEFFNQVQHQNLRAKTQISTPEGRGTDHLLVSL
jgi:hypothetical protein